MPRQSTFQAPPRPRPTPPTSDERGLRYPRRFAAAAVPWTSYGSPQLGCFEELATQARGYITGHPLTAVAVIGALGFWLGRRR